MLTDIQKKQIRKMASKNPTPENMERIGNLLDEEVLAELEAYKTNELESLYAYKQEIEQNIELLEG